MKTNCMEQGATSGEARGLRQPAAAVRHAACCGARVAAREPEAGLQRHPADGSVPCRQQGCRCPQRQQAARSPRRRALSLGGFVVACLVFPLAAEDKLPPPDPAAHTVIVPYDAKLKPDSAKADRFYLGYADFQRLWDLAKESRRPVRPAVETGAPEAFINTALYEGEVLDAGLRVKARFQVITRGSKWAKLALPFKSAGALTIGDVMLDGHAAAFQDGAVLIEEPGTHTVEVAMEIGLERQWKNISLDVPPSSVAVLRLSVPPGDGRPAFGRAAAAAVTEESREGRRIFTLPISGESVLNLTRTPLQRFVADAPPAQAETRAVLRIQPRMERMSAEVAFQFAGTERRGLTVELDPSLHLESATVTPAGVVTLRRDGGRQWLDVAFQPGVAGSATVKLNAVRVFGQQEALGSRTAPCVRGAAVREMSSLELLSTADLLVKLDTATDAERIEPAIVPGAVELVAGAWRLKTGAALRYTVSPAEDRSLAKLETLYQLTRQKAEIIAAIALDSGREALTDARIGVPAGFEVQAMTGPRLVSWHREGDELRLRFDAQPQREARLVLHLAETVAQPAASWTLEPLRLPQFVKHEETVLIATHAADDVKLSFDGTDRKMREEDVNTVKSVIGVKEPLRLKRALRVEKSDWSAVVGLTRQTPRFSADAVLLAQAGDVGLRLSQQVGINIEQGALGGVKLRLPAALPEARVRGAAVRDAQSRVNGGVREYDVTFQTEVLDRVDFTLDLDLPLEGEKILPVLQVDGVSHARRFVIVDNAGTREMTLDSGGADAASKESVPYLPDGLTRPKFFRAGDKSAVKLTFTQLESTAGNAAIVTLAEITTALRPNGERWETVVYSLSNRSLQFLPVRLPRGAELVEVSVGGRTVRADKAERGTAEFLVPLIQMRAGELSQQVRLVYRVPPGKEGVEATHGLDDPELVGLSAERTLWNVWVPGGYEARKFDGNMEEVGEEGTELEKQQSLLSEVSRLNRLLSSKDVSYDDAKLAQDNANKALEQVRQKVANKKRSFYEVQDGKGSAQKNASVVSQLDVEVSKQLEEQGKLLTANSINNPVFSEAQKAQVQSNDVAGQQAFGVQSGNNWDFNSYAAGQKQAVPTKREEAQTDSTMVNDQTLVSNGFFKTGDGTIVLSKSGAGTLNLTAGGALATDAPQIPQQVATQSSLNFNNARANGVTQQFQGSISGTGGVNMTANGTVTLSGANTYTGGLVINGGTLQVAPAEQARRLQESSANMRQRAGATRDQQRGAMLNQVDRAREDGRLGAQQPMAPAAGAFGAGMPSAPAKPEERANRALGNNEAALTAQLKPVGRVSLTVDVPLEGTAFHFRKLKDHAALEVKVRKVWDNRQTTAWWVLGTGLACMILSAMWHRRRASRQENMVPA